MGWVLIRVSTGGGQLWRRWWTFGHYTTRRISWL